MATFISTTLFSTLSRCKLAIATAFMLGMLTTGSQAYTLEQQEMCTGARCGFVRPTFRTSIASPPAWNGNAIP